VSRRRWPYVLAALVLIAAVAVGVVSMRRSRTTIATTTPAGPSSAPPASSPSSSTTSGPARGDVALDTRRQQLIGVRTVAVRRASIAAEIRAAGVVRYDETRQAEVTTRIDGWIRDLFAGYAGKTIRRGEILFTLYSPELIATQNEYLLALRGRSRSGDAEIPAVREYSERLLQSARERLLRFDMAAEDIQELERRGQPADALPVRSPAGGLVVEKTAVKGMRVTAGQTLFKISDLSTVWIEADVPERDLGSVRVGQNASVTLDASPGQTITGRVAYVYPSLDEQSRTGKVRLQIANGSGRLRPGMFATVLLTGTARAVLVVPVDALIETGNEQLVFIARGDGYFEPRHVRAGRRTNDDVEIIEGLGEGETVAGAAAFFLDSESQLRAGTQSYESPGGTAVGGAATDREQLDITLRTQPDPPRTGESTLEAMVKDAKGQPIPDADVTATFFMAAMPAMNMPAMRNQIQLPAVGAGTYRGSGQILTGGRWEVTVDVTRGSQRLGSKQFAVIAQ
jgi:RND family efflux transporter MFP subunit